MAASFSSAAFSTSAFSVNAFLFDGSTPDVVKTGTGGIDPSESHGRTFKPTGIVDRPRKEGRKEVTDRVDESRQIQADIAAKLAREFGEETLRLPQDEQQTPVVQMSLAEVEFEIGVLLHKKLRTQEDELMLILLMAASAA